MSTLVEFNLKAKPAPPKFAKLTDAQVIVDLFNSGEVIETCAPWLSADKESSWSLVKSVYLENIKFNLHAGTSYRHNPTLKYYYFRLLQLKHKDLVYYKMILSGSRVEVEDLALHAYSDQWVSPMQTGAVARETIILNN